MPTYEHVCEKCNFEWEDEYSIKANPPSVCPECKEDGHVKRLISGGSGRGIVILRGHDLTQHIKNEGKRISQEAMKNENVRANIVGEEVYHQQCLENNKLTETLVNIGKDAPTRKQQKELKKGNIKRRATTK